MAGRAAPWLGLLVALIVLVAGQARAQTAPVLLADRVTVDAETRTLTAEGNVEVFYGGARMTAARATYRDGAETVELLGPIQLTGPNGRTVILADTAALSADLQNGLLTGARMLLEQELQLTAARIERIDGRYTRLENTVTTACRICAGGGPPIWEIRAEEVVHDQEERQIYFKGARVRAFGVPIAWLPRLRLPDPTVERMSGFLVPKIINSDNLGFGVKIPYFRTLGDQSDILLTPYLTDTASVTLEYRYRRAFATGDIEVEGAVTRDDLTDDPWRAYVFAEGAFDLPRDWKLQFDVQLTSDPGYLLEYGYSDLDRLDSAISIERVRPYSFTGAEIIGFQSLREDDADSTSPIAVADGVWAWRFSPGVVGGFGQVTAGINAEGRDQSGNGDAARDLMRFSGRGDWRRDWQLPAGMRAGIIARLDGDLYLIAEDDSYDSTVLRVSPRIAAEWRWPLIRSDNGTSQLLEPVAQVVWASLAGNAVPDSDSLLVEFDETNLFSLNRFPGRDRTEEGLFANLGVQYTRRGANGLPLRLAFGRVLRATDRDQFSAPTGLDGAVSDWVVATNVALTDQSGLIGRVVFGDDMAVSTAEVRAGLELTQFDLETTYLWVNADPAQGMPDDMSEWNFDAGWRLSPYWRANAGWRYDAIDGEPTRAGFGLIYENECIAVELAAQRRFTERLGVTPSTDISLQLSFDGFGNGGARPPARSCRG